MSARPSSKRGFRWLGCTEADQAELDVILWEYLALQEEHQLRCPRCQAQRRTGWPCPRIAEGWNVVEGWLVRRRLLSRAEWHRRRLLLAWLDELRRREAS